MKYYPERVIAGFLHTWEMEMGVAASVKSKERKTGRMRCSSSVALAASPSTSAQQAPLAAVLNGGSSSSNVPNSPLSRPLSSKDGVERCDSEQLPVPALGELSIQLDATTDEYQTELDVENASQFSKQPLPEVHSCEAHSHIMNMLNEIGSASANYIIGSVAPMAASVMGNSKRLQLKVNSVSSAANVIPALRIHETSALHFLDAYVQHCVQPDQLLDGWSSLHSLVLHAMQLSDHPFTFLWLLGLVQHFVHRCRIQTLPKKMQKEVQDVAHQLLQTCALMAGQALEYNYAYPRPSPPPSGWMPPMQALSSVSTSSEPICPSGTDSAAASSARRPLSISHADSVRNSVSSPAHVIPLPSAVCYRLPQQEEEDLPPLAPWLALCVPDMHCPVDAKLHATADSIRNLVYDDASAFRAAAPGGLISRVTFVTQGQAGRVSLLALRCLANILAVFINDVWTDGDRASAVLTAILPHFFHLLRNVQLENRAHVLAASCIISSLSVSYYKYTLRAWKKDAWDHFLSHSFFQTSVDVLSQWRFIVSRILSEDKQSLAQLMVFVEKLVEPIH